MPKTKATLAQGQVAIGENLYLFTSPAGATADCLIIAHGGTVPGYKFKVPNGVTIYYTTAFDSKGVYEHGPYAVYSGVRPAVPPGQQAQAGAVITDLAQGKAVGDHWRNSDHAVKEGEHYLALRSQMDWKQLKAKPGLGTNWLPHLVTIRNRKRPGVSRLIWLSRLIQEVQGYNAGITDFYVTSCRAVLDNHPELIAKAAGSQAYKAEE